MNPGTPNTSSSRKYKRCNNDRVTTKISKYFNPIQNADIVESPYKDLLASNDDIKPIEIDDDCDDFKTPKPVRIAKVFEISKQSNALHDKKIKCSKPYKRKKTNVQKKKHLRENNISKLFTKSMENDTELNSEHLHMALALSKSEVQNVDNTDHNHSSNNELTPILSSQEKIHRFKEALEQFGFNMPTKNKNCLSRKEFQTTKRKNSKFKYITPVLCTRTEAERCDLIQNKIALIIKLNDIITPAENIKWQLSTNSLKEHHSEDAIIFNMNGTCLSNEEYFVLSLNVPHCKYVPGCLLKNWEDILGRDKSPERSDNTEARDHIENIYNSKDMYKINSNEINLDHNRDTLEAEHPTEVSLNLENDHENSIPESPKHRSKSLQTSEIRSICEKTNDEVILNSQSNCEDASLNAKINSPIISLESETSCSNYFENLSPDLFSSGDEGVPLKIHSRSISNKNINTSLTEIYSIVDVSIHQTDELKQISVTNDCKSPIREIEDMILLENESVINITISQIDKLKQLSVNKGFESARLEKLKNILGCNNFHNPDIQERPVCLFNVNNDDDGFISTEQEKMETEISNQDNKLIDLTNNTDSDCQIIDESREDTFTSKGKLKRFSSFNSTTSIDSTVSCASDLSIVISDEELNYSTINSTSYRKHKNKKNGKNEHVEPSLMNLSSFFEELSNDLKGTLRIQGTSSQLINLNETEIFECNSPKQEEIDNYNSILPTLANIAAKHTGQNQETGSLKMICKSSLLNGTKNVHNPDEIVLQKPQTNNSNHSNSPTFNGNKKFVNLTTKLSKSPEGTPPNNDTFLIKTDNITPLPNYMVMDTPKIAGELKKFGLKPLKRKRGVQLLQYLYDVTHPEVPEEKSVDSENAIYHELGVKRRVPSKNADIINSLSAVTDKVEIVGDIISESESVDDLILEHKHSIKISTCAVPLNIAWHNLLAANPSIRESMLIYEPLEVDNLYMMLKAQGMKYNIQDVVTFLDRQCITIRTKQRKKSSTVSN